MNLVEILRISSPSNFWIAEKDSDQFINLISEFIKQEQNDASLGSENCLNDKEIISFYDLNRDKFYRARIIEQITSFRSNCFSLFMIDLAERITVPKNYCQPILNEKLKKLPPLARQCCLYDIQPIKNDWSPSSIRFMSEMKKKSDQIYVEKIDKNPESSIRQVKLYIHLKQGDNNDFYLMDLNHLLIENKFAVWSNRTKPIEQTSMDLSIEKDFKYQYKNSSKKINIDPSVYRKNFDNLGSIKLALSEYSLKKKSPKATKDQNHSEDEDKMNSTIKSVASTVFDQDKLDSEFSNLLDLEKYIKNPAGPKTIDTKSWRTMDPYIFTHNTSVISIQSTKDQRIHPSVRDFLSLHGILTVSDLNSYLWPCILHGLHTFFIPDEHDHGKNSPMAFITPLMSLLLEKSSQEIKKKFETGFVKRSIAQSQCQNGPILLVVCASSENAQKIYEMINQIIQIDSRLNGRDKLKALMIQGGGHENQYDVPLANGIDILIAATPFCLLRAIGEAKTNLERIRYIVFDQANLLLEKFPLQIKTLMEVYTNFIEINECPYRAQFVLISHFWSTMLKKFIDKFLIKPAFIIGNKLEASFYGQTHHVLKDMEADQTVNKGSMIRKLIEKNRHHNVLICANTFERTIKLYDYLFKKCQIEVDCVTHESRSPKIHTLEEKWSQKQSQGLVMVIQQQMLEHLNIDSVKCVINYDFPLTKTAYALRLWTMRSYFVQKKDLMAAKNDGLKISESFRVEADSNGQWKDMASDCLCSYLLLSKSSSGFAYSLFNFLSRIGYQKSCFPHGFLKMVEEGRLKKEESKLEYPLCPYVKSFGSCMNATPNSCKYRHRPNRKADQVGLLDKDLTVPTQGYVRFKISFIKDTNHFFGNVISHQNFNEESSVCYDQFKELDLTIQLYFSDTNNIKYLTKFKEDELYAFKDTGTSVFKRIKIEEVIRKDGQIAFELVVKCIDYGSKLQISAQDLIKLPDQFKILPPQAVEIYLCDIRPIEKDLAWSVQSRVFISEKLQKHKEFIGKIQLAASNTLWLHPITSYKHLRNLDLLVREDSIQSELIENNYGVRYPMHLKKLRNLFQENDLFVPKLEDNLAKIKKDSNEFYELFYDLTNCKEEEFKPDFSFLNKNSLTENLVYLSSIQDSMKKIYLQLTKFYDNLLSLNDDIGKYMERILKIKDNSKLKNRKRDDESDDFIVDLNSEDKISADLVFWQRTLSIRQKINKNVIGFLRSICKSLYCIVLNKSEYNRGEILDVLDNGTVKIYFVDFGDVGFVSSDDIFPISPTFIRQLPFQAIECSIEGIIPNKPDLNNNYDEWTKESIDFFLSLTRDKEEKFFDLYAQVLDTHDSFKYLIRLFSKTYPENVDLSFEMVTYGYARLDSVQESKLFYLCDKNENQLIQLAKQFVNLFIKNSDLDKQKRFLEVLNCKPAFFQIMKQDEIVESGLLQCLSQGLMFIKDSKLTLLILMFIRKIILIKKNDNCELIKVFVDYRGFAKLFCIMNQDEQELTNFALNFLKELISLSNELKRFLINNSNYLKSILYLIELFKNETLKTEKCLDLLDNLVNHFDDQTKFDSNLIDYFYNLAKRINLSDNLLEKINCLFEEFAKKEILVGNEQHSETLAESEFDNEPEKEQEIHTNILNDGFKSDTSSDEIIEEFDKAFMEMILGKMKIPATDNVVVSNVNWEPKKEYIYPKCVWDQDSDFVYVKILLKNVKDCELNFGSNLLSFRCIVENKKYGLDLELFSDIENDVESFSEIDCFRIKMKKKYSGVWIRLLSSIIKPNFIKSEYNNLDYSSDSDTEKKKRFSEYLSAQPCKDLVKFTPESPVVSASESDSDFEDHDTDMKELKEYRWE